MPVFLIAKIWDELQFAKTRELLRKKRIFCASVMALGLLMVTSVGLFAHPLGNFTVNRYSKLSVATDQAELFYVLDIAEIPAHRMQTQMDSDGNGEISPDEQQRYLDEQKTIFATNVSLQIDDHPVQLQNQSINIAFQTGQAGLPTIRIEARYRAALQLTAQSTVIEYRDNNFADQLGWQEVVMDTGEGVALDQSTVPSKDISDALRSYPSDLMTAPPVVNSASATVHLGSSGVAGNEADRQSDKASGKSPVTSLGKPTDGFAELINTTALTPWTIFLAILAAFGWGAAHAMSPGHGKTIVGAYLVGTRGTVNHAIFLGLTTTITHTAGVFALGFVTLFLSNFILPETLYPWLGVFSGLMIVGLGLTMSWSRLKAALGLRSSSHTHDHDHAHSHEHDHTHDHDHDHDHHSHASGITHHAFYHDHGDGHYHSHLPPVEPTAVTWRSLLALGVSGGLIPCPSALVLMLGAISLHRVGFGLLLIFVFSLGLASVLSGIGILLVKARSLFDSVAMDGRGIRLLPVASALIITIVGIGITWQALVSTGVLAPQSFQIAQMF